MKYLLLFAFAISAFGDTNFTVQATVTISTTTNWDQVVGTLVPSNGGFHSTLRRGYIFTNTAAFLEWKGQIHQISLESKPGPSVGTFLFEPSNVLLPDGTLQGAHPIPLPPSMPPPLPK